MQVDRRIDQVSNLTDFDYALIVKGTDVAKVTKQQLAELVGNLLYGATTKETLASVVAALLPFNSRLGTYTGDVNELHKTAGTGISVWSVLGSATNPPTEDQIGGILINCSRYNPENQFSVVFQIYVSAKGSSTFLTRSIHYTKSSGVDTFTDWV